MPTYTYVQNASGEVLYADANGQPQGIDAITWNGTNLAVGATMSVTGVATLGGSSAGELRLLEPSAGGTSYIALKAPSLAGNVTWTLPTADGSSGQFLKTNGSGTLSWDTISGGGDALTTNPLSQFAATTSAQLAGVISDETGTGALVFANTPTLVTPVLGTPTSGTLTNCTGLPISTGVSGLGSGVATFLATPSSANLAAAVTGETGSGALMFGTSPTITTDITIPNTGLHLLDTDSSHDLIIAPGSNLTADRTLTITTGDADRTLTISASATISGTNSGDVTLSGTPDYITISSQVITVGLVDLTTDVTGDLPLANLAQASAASKLLGRGSAAGAGDYQEITLGTGLSMSGTTLSASGSSTVIPGLFQARLTLADGIAEFTTKVLTPSATDTTAETCDFSSAHGWTTGTMVTVGTTAGGLTAGTIYYIRAVDTDTISFHTTLADAEADTSKVNLTASITATVTSFGVSSTTIRLTKFQGDQINLPVSSTWTAYTISSDITLALGTLTSGKNYDVFLKSVSGTPTLSLSSAWTSDTVRADALSTLNGVRVLGSDTDKVLVGTIRTVSTTATVFSNRQAFVANEFNRLPFVMYREDTGSHTPGTTEREWNGGSTLRCEFVSAKPHNGTLSFSVRNANASGNLIMYAGFDAANLGDFIQLRPEQLKISGSTTRFYATEGYHYTTIREKDFSTGGTADFGYNTTLVFL